MENKYFISAKDDISVVCLKLFPKEKIDKNYGESSAKEHRE